MWIEAINRGFLKNKSIFFKEISLMTIREVFRSSNNVLRNQWFHIIY